MAELIETDVLVVGAGGAGMRAAYEAHMAGVKVLLAVKGRFGAIGVRGGGATGSANSERGTMRPVGLSERWPGERLEPDKAYEDVIQCGLDMADRKLVRVLVDDALECRRALEGWGATLPVFVQGHGVNTHGVPIMTALQSALSKSDVLIREGMAVTDLLVKDRACVGALALDEQTGEPLAIKAASTILATGGLGRLYRLNFHPSCVTGDGYAIGYEAGAELLNMEFHQIFLGTVFPSVNLIWRSWVWEDYPRLIDTRGEEFLERYLPPGATAKECMDQRRLHGPFSTRDALSRYIDVAIASEVKEGRGTPSGGVFMQRNDGGRNIPPDIMEFYHYRGIHWDRGRVEIGVCHHCCDGGFRISEDAETTVAGLFAAGEAAAGMHGADRMGGMMLLASQVFGARAGRQAARRAKAIGSVAIDPEQVASLESTLTCPQQGDLKVAQVAEALGNLAWNDLLVGRTPKGLTRGRDEIARMRAEDLPRLAIQQPVELVRAAELRNQLRAAEIVARAALERKESRGGHHRIDFPTQDDAGWLKAISVKKKDGQMNTWTWPIDPDWKPRREDMWGRQWG